jgi:serine/threonine-protein kinase ATR
MANLLAENKEERRKKDLVGRFLQQHGLGITARLAEVINDNVAKHPPVQEQQRCIRAVEEMVTLCGPYIRIARPQVR